MTLETLDLKDPELTGLKSGGTSDAQAPAPHGAAQPAPAAEDQKAPGESHTDPETTGDSEQAERTPEQIEAQRREKARAHERRRLERARTRAAEAAAEAKLLREALERERAARTQRAEGEPLREHFEDYESYLEARAEYRAEKKVAEALKAREEAQRAQERERQAAVVEERTAREWAGREKAFMETAQDYEAVVLPFVDEELQSLDIAARRAIVESDKGPQLLYHLAQNAEEAERIARLSPVRQVAELGKLEDRLSTPAKRTTSAPAPATPVASRGSAGKKLEDMSIEETRAFLRSAGARYV